LAKLPRLSEPIQTDQYRCYDPEGNEIPCAGTGQDGDLKKGRAWPDPRFEVHKEWVLDRLTQHIWTKNANLPGFPLTWEEGHAYVDAMNAAAALGRSDWKLPSRAALFGLVSHVNVNPALPEGHPFVDVFSGYYWTRTPVVRFSSQAWYVHLGGARVFKGMKHGSYMVWPVAENLPEGPGETARFVGQGSTVRDQSTGLEWMRQAGEIGPLDWESAFQAVDSMNGKGACGFTDWRLPNVRELESLVCLEGHTPALSPNHPFRGVEASYWSATTSSYEGTYAWVLHMDDGAIGVGFKKNKEFWAWPVRDGDLRT